MATYDQYVQQANDAAVARQTLINRANAERRQAEAMGQAQRIGASIRARPFEQRAAANQLVMNDLTNQLYGATAAQMGDYAGAARMVGGAPTAPVVAPTAAMTYSNEGRGSNFNAGAQGTQTIMTDQRTSTPSQRAVSPQRGQAVSKSSVRARGTPSTPDVQQTAPVAVQPQAAPMPQAIPQAAYDPMYQGGPVVIAPQNVAYQGGCPSGNCAHNFENVQARAAYLAGGGQMNEFELQKMAERQARYAPAFRDAAISSDMGARRTIQSNPAYAQSVAAKIQAGQSPQLANANTMAEMAGRFGYTNVAIDALPNQVAAANAQSNTIAANALQTGAPYQGAPISTGGQYNTNIANPSGIYNYAVDPSSGNATVNFATPGMGQGIGQTTLPQSAVGGLFANTTPGQVQTGRTNAATATTKTQTELAKVQMANDARRYNTDATTQRQLALRQLGPVPRVSAALTPGQIARDNLAVAKYNQFMQQNPGLNAAQLGIIK